MFVEAYISSVTEIIGLYKPQQPLVLFLKQYFKINKKFGARDRKFITALLYGFYRLGKNQTHLSIREQIILGSFLSAELPEIFFQKTNSKISEGYFLNFDEKKEILINEYKINFSIPFELTKEIDEEEYIKYLFRPAAVFIRIRKNAHHIKNKLYQAKVPFNELSPTCFSFQKNIKLQEVLGETDEYVIQDYSSQMCTTVFETKNNEKWWDCCAASGGKSLLIYDKNNHIQLDVSDIRKTIIERLKKRFDFYHLTPNKIFVHDARLPLKQYEYYDSVLIDAPCSGSGTWSRSPEQYYFFSKEKLAEFKKLQTEILKNISGYTKKSVYYLTCSVFADENEHVVDSLVGNHFFVNEQRSLNAFEKGGDHIFASHLCKIN